MKDLFVKEGRFTVNKNTGYRIDRLMFGIWAVLVIIMVVATFLWVTKNGSFYLHCPEDARGACANPYYEVVNCFKIFHNNELSFLCEQELLLPGETYGKRLPWFARDLGFKFFASFMAVLFINHFVHNKRLLVRL